MIMIKKQYKDYFSVILEARSLALHKRKAVFYLSLCPLPTIKMMTHSLTQISFRTQTPAPLPVIKILDYSTVATFFGISGHWFIFTNGVPGPFWLSSNSKLLYLLKSSPHCLPLISLIVELALLKYIHREISLTQLKYHLRVLLF